MNPGSLLRAPAFNICYYMYVFVLKIQTVNVNLMKLISSKAKGMNSSHLFDKYFKTKKMYGIKKIKIITTYINSLLIERVKLIVPPFI